jgi:hypothetical protein
MGVLNVTPDSTPTAAMFDPQAAIAALEMERQRRQHPRRQR